MIISIGGLIVRALGGFNINTLIVRGLLGAAAAVAKKVFVQLVYEKRR